MRLLEAFLFKVLGIYYRHAYTICELGQSVQNDQRI